MTSNNLGRVRRSNKKRSNDPRVMLVTDLEGCVFQSLGDVE